MQTVTQEKQFNSICLVEVAVEWAVNASRSRKNNKSGSRVESETRSGSLVPRRRTVAANCVTSSNVLHNVIISRNYSHNATKYKNRTTKKETRKIPLNYWLSFHQRHFRASSSFLFPSYHRGNLAMLQSVPSPSPEFEPPPTITCSQLGASRAKIELRGDNVYRVFPCSWSISNGFSV